MNITAITRYKHGELYAILRRIGWTQAELARQTGMHAGTIGDIINLFKRPTAEQANAIQQALGLAGEYLDVLSEWPEAFEGLKRGYRREQTATIPMDRLLDHPEILQLAAPDNEDNYGLEERMEDVMSELSSKEQAVLRERFWNGKTFTDIGKTLNRTRAEAHLIEQKALRRLRHPATLKRLAQEL